MKPPTHLQTPLPTYLPLNQLIAMFILLPPLQLFAAGPPLARPGCPETCGGVTIPFPFGIGPNNCFLEPWFEIKCKPPSPGPGASPKPFLSKLDIEVMEIPIGKNYPDYRGYQNFIELSSLTVSVPFFNMCSSADTKHFGVDLRDSPFNFSTQHNVLMMEGCPGSAVLINQSDTIVAGCGTFCQHGNKSSNNCHGVGCCQVPLPLESRNRYTIHSPLQFYRIGFYGQPSESNCLVAALVKSELVDDHIGRLSTTSPAASTVPVLLYWSWLSTRSPDYNPRADCWQDTSLNVTLCSCQEDSVGNPYVLNGCQVDEECKKCPDDCHWNDISSSHLCYTSTTYKLFHFFISIAIVFSVGPLLVVFGFRWLIRFIKRRRKTDRRVKFLKSKLDQHQSSSQGFVERTKLYTRKHLDKATDHFHENRVLGKGGQGIVYKGMLTDGRTVAIKKSNRVDESQMEQFINEVVVLSQINHRHVVKLLGCCLETEFPLVVYEFISNGTLAQHIHDPDDDFPLSWPMRLKIAADSAGAIAYLHSASSTPIYHRDIKPANILLDDKHRAKVSDFGSSKTITLEQTHLTTLVQGTMGYLDPEYFESNMFTEKSDVYSFGVVLLEVLTSKKPIYRNEEMEQKSLVTEFFLHMQDSRLPNILDPEVVKEAKQEELLAVVDLATRCLNGSGRWRPTMKEVAMTLEVIIKSPNETSTHHQRTLPNREFREIAMLEMSDDEFMSTPAPASAASSMYTDANPLLRDTI